MQIKYALTFERERVDPLTVYGLVEGGTLAACMGRAVRQAVRRHPGQSWQSAVLVVEKPGQEGHIGRVSGSSESQQDGPPVA